MFDDVLIESAGKDRRKGGLASTLLSLAIHAALIGAVVMAGYYVKENPQAIEKPMNAFIVGSAPPPPPPPPPPAASSVAAATQHVRVEPQQSQETFRQPNEMPQTLNKVDENVAQQNTEVAGAMPGGVAGGKEGGVVGGDLEHGVVGGDLEHGVPGGDLNGRPGGQVGGGGNTAGAPVRVGGIVLAPKIVSRIEPRYTEAARNARIQGIVIVEAIIDPQGNVTDARILKPLGFGLDQQALAAIREWKFRPGTLNGQPISVYFNLTINFHINQ